VNAGFNVRGEEKNCEKWGSWALAKNEQDKRSNNIRFLITAVSGNKNNELWAALF